MRSFLVELGMGTDLHRAEPTKCASRAVKDAIRRTSLVGLFECGLLSSIKEMVVRIKIGVPSPEKVDREEVIKAVPYGKCEVEVVEGGLLEEGGLKRDGTRDHLMVAVAALTILVP